MPHEVKFCRNIECRQFNREQTYHYTPANWYHPAEGDDPECRACAGEVWNRPLYADDVIEDVAALMPPEDHDWGPAEIAVLAAMQAYANARRATR